MGGEGQAVGQAGGHDQAVGRIAVEAIRELIEGRWQGGIREFGLKEDGVGWVYDDQNKALVPDRVKARVDSLKAEIVAGRIVVPTE
jgi:basic membrane protein A